MSLRLESEYHSFIAKQAKPWIKGNIWSFEGEWGQFTFMELPTLALMSTLIILPIAAITGFSTMFSMRGIGLFGRYFNGELELMNESDKGEPCGFGPRYLAAIIDFFMVPLTSILVATDRVLQMINLFSILIIVLAFVTLPEEARTYTLPGILIMAVCIQVWTYYAVQEAGYEQCTTGKNALNLIVTDMEGNRITRKAATKRLLMKIVGAIPLFGGLIMAAFSPNSQALHDKAAKTLVVWRGESEQSRL